MEVSFVNPDVDTWTYGFDLGDNASFGGIRLLIASNGEWMLAVYYESSYYSSASAYYIVQVGDLRDHGIPFNSMAVGDSVTA